MSLRPTGHRILVQPDEQPEQSAGGLILPQDHDHMPVSGTVVALGPGGSQVRYRARQQGIRDCCEVLESIVRQHGDWTVLRLALNEMAGMLGTTEIEREIAVGDRVVYPAESGLVFTQDGQQYIILNEDDVAVVVADEVVAA